MIKRVLVFWLTVVGTVMIARDLASSQGRARLFRAYEAENQLRKRKRGLQG